MWICDPLSRAPPLSSPLHPSRWQRLQTAFSHAFPKSRYVDSIRLTSHNGEFVQQGAPHYLNPSVALPLFEICGLDWHGLPCVSFRDGQKVNSSAPFEVHETWLWSIDAKSPLGLPKCLHWSGITAASRYNLCHSLVALQVRSIKSDSHPHYKRVHTFHIYHFDPGHNHLLLCSGLHAFCVLFVMNNQLIWLRGKFRGRNETHSYRV